jgi:hypothetical protein
VDGQVSKWPILSRIVAIPQTRNGQSIRSCASRGCRLHRHHRGQIPIASRPNEATRPALGSNVFCAHSNSSWIVSCFNKLVTLFSFEFPQL